ncbi:MAG: homoserine kinase [Caulobacteraceae bacterium]|nr:homoserine kinase [Caulobacter sp.]
MAVYTDITDAELQGLLARYDLGRARALKGIAEGIENSNFLLETQAGRFILTVYERRVRAADLPFFLELMGWLARRGFPCPTPVPTREGALLSSVRAKPCAIVSFLPGLSIRAPDAAHARAAGEALARMHAAGEGFAPTRANDLGLPAWRPLLEAHAALAERLRPGLLAQARADLDALERGWPEGLPAGVIHADLFPDNVFFDGDRFAGAIDFYFACTDALAYDLAVMLNSWAFPDRRLDPARARALAAGYQAVRPLEAAEHASLGLLARGAAMRFFLTRLADWEATPPGALVSRKDPLEYADRLDQWRALGDRPLLEALSA